ncbi:uncharacterized protein I303_101346 [Kwoniella dejecticola CBS 10117]|uniref:Uncharacterized protein n=1 Tax=Kwoniella dejecticola CBS 10117 TaxID=1296121 RepID=A0A1A6AHH9_9TREE|nr:uncharacterized protein I303_01355 [Kwoniella dejecticola CBS 10117]OBR89527.1 hypothetical protein I303_01355 [Kwoniella dejecticola CBS 10117]
MPRDLGQRAQNFREQWLAPSGGWLAEIVIIMSDSTGIWDLIILSGVFVGSWIILRTSPMEISLILALAFDLTIPLQYHNDEYLSSKHEVHLQNYWPTFMIGCIVEGVSFFFLHPDLFTLIVCVKTTFMLLIWLSKDQEGLAIKRRKSGTGPDGRSNQPDNRRSRQPSPDSPSDLESESRPRKSSQSSTSPPANMPKSRHIKDPYKYLKRAGYDDPAIAGMINTMNEGDKDQAKKLLQKWMKPKDADEVKRRNQQYGQKAKDAGWQPSPSGSGPARGPGDGSSGGNSSLMPKSKYVPDAHKYLKRAGYEDPAIAGMILSLNQMKNKHQAKKQFSAWAREKDPKHIQRRNTQYAERAKQAGWKGAPNSGSGGGSGSASAYTKQERIDDGPPNMPTSYFVPTSKGYAELKKAGYDEPAIAGMLALMNTLDQKQALNNYEVWTSEKNPEQIKRRNKQYGDEAREMGYPDKPKMNAHVGGNPFDKMKKKLGIPVNSVKKVEALLNSKEMKQKGVKPEMKDKILSTLKNPTSEQEIQQVVKVLRSLGVDIQSDEMQDGWMSPDGKGGYRDIVLRQNDMKKLVNSMRQKGFTKEQMNQWIDYLAQPLSRNEFEEKVIPLGKRVGCSIGEGYHGTGPHKIDPKKLSEIRTAIQEKTGVNASLLDHIIVKAINIKDPKQAQNRLNSLMKDGITREEFEKYRKEVEWS